MHQHNNLILDQHKCIGLIINLCTSHLNCQTLYLDLCPCLLEHIYPIIFIKLRPMHCRCLVFLLTHTLHIIIKTIYHSDTTCIPTLGASFNYTIRKPPKKKIKYIKFSTFPPYEFQSSRCNRIFANHWSSGFA